MKNNRMETLNKAGINTNKYFTLTVNEDMPKGTKINVEVEKAYVEISQQIKEDGYVKNSKLHRRWIMAQYFRMLNHKDGWHGALKNYSYMYTIDMMTEEVRVLSKLEKRDREVFKERSSFFTYKVVRQVVADYINNVEKYLSELPVQNCKGQPYVRIRKYSNCFVNEIETKVLGPIKAVAEICNKSYGYEELYKTLCTLRKVMIDLPYETRKSKAWVNAFQGSGAYYTLKNMIMFHNVALKIGKHTYCYGVEAVTAIRALLGIYEGYQFNALLKATIEFNNFKF